MCAQALGRNGRTDKGTSLCRPWTRAEVPEDACLIHVDSLQSPQKQLNQNFYAKLARLLKNVVNERFCKHMGVLLTL